MLRGIVRSRSGDSLSFRACEGSLLMLALDSTGTGVRPMYRLMNASELDGMYLLARGNQSRDGNVVTFREVQFASRPGAGASCDDPAPDYLAMARGINPVWRVLIREQGVEVSLGDSVRMEFPATAREDSADAIRYQVAAGDHSLHLLLNKAECSEGGSGNYMVMRAVVLVDGRPLQGCGWMGRLP